VACHVINQLTQKTHLHPYIQSLYLFGIGSFRMLITSVDVLQDHLRRILRGQVSLFDWSRSTSLARTFSPRVLENQIDARKVTNFN
jgi:hypothetical protein